MTLEFLNVKIVMLPKLLERMKAHTFDNVWSLKDSVLINISLFHWARYCQRASAVIALQFHSGLTKYI